jgi:hypothetical protein
LGPTNNQILQASEKELLSIGIIPENHPTLDSSANDVLQRTLCADSRSSWHGS